MNIILLTSSLSAGGAERVASTLCNAWAARGDTVTLIPTYSGGGTPFYAIDKGVNLIYLASQVKGNGRTPLGYLKRLYALRQLIKQQKPDVVISFLPNVNIAAIFSTAFIRAPLIICERTDPTQMPSRALVKLCTRLFYRYADALCVQTEVVKNKAKSLFPNLNRIENIPNPLPETISALTPITTTATPILLSLGRLSREKQVHRIIDGFNQVHNVFPQWQLHIYGDGSERSALEKQVEKLGIQQHILFMGTTSEPWQVMANSSAFIMTSQFEGFPNALMEAMAIGLPCITFDCPSGPRELSENGTKALLVPLNNQEELIKELRNVLSNEKLRNELGAKARQAILARYQLPVILQEWDALFKKCGVKSAY